MSEDVREKVPADGRKAPFMTSDTSFDFSISHRVHTSISRQRPSVNAARQVKTPRKNVFFVLRFDVLLLVVWDVKGLGSVFGERRPLHFSFYQNRDPLFILYLLFEETTTSFPSSFSGNEDPFPVLSTEPRF